MKKRFAKLINVKSIVTLITAVVFAVLSLLGKVSPEQFLTIFTVIVGFYFGTQYEKKNQERQEEPEADTEPADTGEEAE